MTYLPKGIAALTESNFLAAVVRCQTPFEVEAAYERWKIEFPAEQPTFRRIADAALNELEKY